MLMSKGGNRLGRVEITAQSDNITYIEQKRQVKATAFMKIKRLLLTNFVCKGTQLQRNVDGLKYLAKQQTLLLQGLRVNPNKNFRRLSRTDQQVQHELID